MTERWVNIATSFEQNVDSVFRLLDFDKIIIDAAVAGLEQLGVALEETNRHIQANTVRNRATALLNIKHSGSLRPYYQTMFNQCVVLLVLYFDSAIHDACRKGIVAALKSDGDSSVKKEELKISWRTIGSVEGERESVFADLLLLQRDVSFQDMKSIVNAFDDYVGITLERSQRTDNIILGQAARHAIVHALGRIDDRMVRQLAGAKMRTLKPVVQEGSLLDFSPTEIAALAIDMKAYCRDVCEKLSARFG